MIIIVIKHQRMFWYSCLCICPCLLWV